MRQYKFDRGDWVAVRNHNMQYQLRGKVVDADSESITVQNRSGVREHYVLGDDVVVHAYWRGRRWYVR